MEPIIAAAELCYNTENQPLLYRNDSLGNETLQTVKKNSRREKGDPFARRWTHIDVFDHMGDRPFEDMVFLVTFYMQLYNERKTRCRSTLVNMLADISNLEIFMRKVLYLDHYKDFWKDADLSLLGQPPSDIDILNTIDDTVTHDLHAIKVLTQVFCRAKQPERKKRAHSMLMRKLQEENNCAFFIKAAAKLWSA